MLTKVAFLVSLLLASCFKSMDSKRVESEKLEKLQQGLGIDKAEEVVASEQEATEQAKEEAQTELVAADSGEVDAEQATADEVAAQKAGAEQATAGKAIAEKEAAEKAAADTVAAVETAADMAAGTIAAGKAVAEKEAVEPAAADKSVSEKVAAEKRVESGGSADKAAADEAAADRVAAEKAPAEKEAAKRALAAADKTAVASVLADLSSEEADKEEEVATGLMEEEAKEGFQASAETAEVKVTTDSVHGTSINAHMSRELKLFKKMFGASAGEPSNDLVFKMHCPKAASLSPTQFTILYDDESADTPKCQDIKIDVKFTDKVGKVTSMGEGYERKINDLCQRGSLFLRKVGLFDAVTDVNWNSTHGRHVCKQGTYTVQASEPVVVVDLWPKEEELIEERNSQEEKKTKPCYENPIACKTSGADLFDKGEGLTTKFCDLESGECKKCEPWDWGAHCNKKCPKVCKGDGVTQRCDQRDGHCSYCAPGKWGPECAGQCPKCLRGECDVETGHCTRCAAGKWGPKCAGQCPNCLWGNCDVKTGRCTGYCVNGKWGDDCLSECSENCETQGVRKGCDRKTARCLACKDGTHRVQIGDACVADAANAAADTVATETKAAEAKAAKKKKQTAAAQDAGKKPGADRAAVEEAATVATEMKVHQDFLRASVPAEGDGEKGTSMKPKNGAIAKDGALGAIAVAFLIAAAA